MTTEKSLGIWMDHASAHVIPFSQKMQTIHVHSNFTKDDREETIARSEHIMHNKEHGRHLEYYKQLGEIIKQYQSVLLFGPTDAKRELHNHLTADHRFADIKIEVQQTDKMTEHEEHEFVRKHFSKRFG